MKQLLLASTSLYLQLTASNLLSNYIALVPGVPTRLHFTDDYKITRTIADGETGKPKEIHSLVFYVNTLGGEDVSRTFSILSQKLAAHFEPFLKDKKYVDYDFIVTEIGTGFLKDWNVQVIKRPEAS